MSNFHLQEIQSLQNSLREREEYVTELENRLRALWDKYDGDRKHYMDRIKQLEEELMDVKNEHAVLVADVVLRDDKIERIAHLEEENDAMRADLLLWKDWVEDERGNVSKEPLQSDSSIWAKAGIGFTTEDKP